MSAALAVLAGGCVISKDFSETSFQCAEQPICPDGYSCIDGMCVLGASGVDGGDDPDASGPIQSELAFRRKLTFANGDRALLSSVPVLVRLDATRIEYGSVRPDGADIEFRDADGTLLPHETEIWDPAGESIIWVRVPTIDGGSTTDSIWMYYGNPDVEVLQEEAAVWTTYRAVYHLNAAGETEADDSTGQSYDGTLVGTALVDGQVGQARSFNGTDQYINLGTNRDFATGVAGVTMEAWVQVGDLLANAVAIGVSINGAASSRLQLQLNVTEVPNGGARTIDGGTLVSASGAALAIGDWTWVVYVLDFAGDSIRIYYDGVEVSSATALAFDDATPPTTSNQATIGMDEDLTTDFFLGSLDEVRIANAVYDADWVSAQYASMTDALVTFGPVETNSRGSR